MVQISAQYSSRPFQINMSQTLMSQNVDGNYSIIRTRIWISKQSYSPSWSNGNSSWSATVNGVTRSDTFTYDFRNADSKELVTFDQQINHNADGTKSYTYSVGSSADGLGTANASGPVSLITIPRATQPSLTDNSIDAGDTTTVNLPRASSGFTSTVSITFGNTRYVFANKYNGNSLDITPPRSLLNQIPGALSGSGSIVVDTYSGNTLIGTRTTGIRLYAGAETAPTFDGISLSEANAAIDNAGLSGYIQNVTKLAYSINGATANYGASIAGYKLTVAGLSMTSRTGTTATITKSGTVTVTATITDSRGRTATSSVNINVQAYSPPKLTKVSIQRANASGVSSPTDGTYGRVNINGSITTIKSGSTELNGMTIRVYSRLKGATTWGSAKVTSSPSGLSYNNYVLASGYLVSNSYEFQVQLSDKLTTSVIQIIMGAATVFMHWDGQSGVGINKFRENGALDVNGDIYNHNGSIVEPAGMIVAWAGTGSAPKGWLICNGGAVSRATYNVLYAAIGTAYGTGDGSTTFAVPDLRNRTIHGYNSGNSAFNPVGFKDGETNHTLTVDELPSHSHAQFVTANSGGTGIRRDYSNDGTGLARYAQGVQTDVTGGGSSHNNLAPYMALNWIIKT